MGLFGFGKNKKNELTKNHLKRAIYQFLGGNVIWDSSKDDAFVKAYSENPTLYSIINLIVKTSNNVPLKVYEITDETNAKNYKSITSGTIDDISLKKANVLKKNAFADAEESDLYKILNNPNPSQSQTEWLGELISFGLLTGDRYVYGLRTLTGEYQDKPKHLFSLPSHNVQIVMNESSEILLNGEVMGYKLSHAPDKTILKEDVLHVKDFNPNYDGTGAHLYGQSPLIAGAKTLQINNEALTTGASLLQNQTARGVLSNADATINDDQAKQLKDSFKKQYRGSEKAGDIAVTIGKYDWIKFGLTTADLELLAQYQVSIKDLCNIYGVPVELLNNTESSTYNNAKQKSKQLYQNAVIPELIKIRDGLNKWLVPQFNEQGKKYYIDFDFSAIPELQEDLELVAKRMSTSWWLSPNEKRKEMNFSPIENSEMDEIYAPANLMPLDETDQNLENPTPTNG